MADDRLGIGALIRQLEGDFPDVTISKIRFLESEGLVEPARTASGYRKYSAADVDRLRFVLSAQRDRFWPLKVIRERLDAVDRGLAVADDGVVTPPRDVPSGQGRLSATARPLRITAIELQHAADIDTGTFRELVSYGLLPKNREHFDADDLDVARVCGSLVSAGIDVRHLRPFKSAAERELDLADHVLGQQALRGRRADAAGLDDESVRQQVLEDCLDLHVALVRRGLDRQR
ncbi:transcriptional regulator FtsR [Janibacter limosus]|uniref:transcriptional regulator FtsR n=1 Tax=Janibacter limosus TaxID=53458 RepID=UPI000A75E26B|nr:MerR family transcriptional regulator [Janibacter limosus]